MPARLELEGLTTHIRIHRGELVAVDRLSLTVEEGETLGMVGESGCGKTITALSIMGLLPPGGHVAGGRILYQGQDLANLPERHMRRLRGQEIAMVFQDPAQALNPTMAIGEQVAGERSLIELRLQGSEPVRGSPFGGVGRVHGYDRDPCVVGL